MPYSIVITVLFVLSLLANLHFVRKWFASEDAKADAIAAKIAAEFAKVAAEAKLTKLP